VLNLLALVCVSRSFGPLFFTPALLSLFTLGYSMSPVTRYRVMVIVTGCVVLLGSVAVEVLGSLVREVGARIPPSYEFGVDHRSMTIIARAVELSYGPTVAALTAGAFLLIVGPALMMGQQQEVLRKVERRSALQTWHLKHLLPDEAQEPVSRTGR
jgi:serine/threonine-protein kinase